MVRMLSKMGTAKKRGGDWGLFGHLFRTRLFAILLVFCLLPTLSSCREDRSHLSLHNVLLFGDSYSTFTGEIPEGYASWYSPDATYTDVTSPEDTWWGILMEETRSDLLLNSSYSGSTLSHTGYHGEDNSDISFLARAEALCREGFFDEHTVDTVLIYGGLNDAWAGVPYGDMSREGDPYHVYPAFINLLALLKDALPEARVIVMVEAYLPEEMKTGLEAIAEEWEAESLRIPDVSKIDSHPDRNGMREIADAVIGYLEKTWQNKA